MTQPEAARRRSLRDRIRLFRFGAAIAIALLLLSFWQIQVVERDRHRSRAQRNSIKTLPVTAARGNVVDRHGRLLAQSQPVLSAMIDPARAVPENLPAIADGLGLDLERLRGRLSQAIEFGGSGKIVLKDSLTVRDLSFLEARRGDLPEIDTVNVMRRQYSASAVAVHALGYVGPISRAELNQRGYLLHQYGALIGKSGLERQYDRWLTGMDGGQQLLVDARGRELANLGEVASRPGEDLKLTIDLDLQVVAELGLEGRKGAVVALDPRTGEVLAMASAPAFDPNGFVTGLTGEEWLRINTDPRAPMLNRAIQGTFAMGSVFKPIHALAGLEQGAVGTDFRVHCPGGMPFGGRYFRCHKRGGHGTVDLQRAIAVSCDVYFYQLGNRLGVDTLAQYARMAGLGARTGIDLPGEVAGLVPSVRWKVLQAFEPWYPAETMSVSIGQGAMAVTPIQAAQAIGGLAMGGVWHRPHLVSRKQRAKIDPRSRPSSPRTAAIAAAHMETIRDGLSDVVNNGGTGGQARLSGARVCGKTGTSQRVSNDLRLRANREDFEDDAWFVGFAPCQDPEIVVAALLENGRHSYYAAALARDVMEAWLVSRPPDAREDAGAALALSVGEVARP